MYGKLTPLDKDTSKLSREPRATHYAEILPEIHRLTAEVVPGILHAASVQLLTRLGYGTEAAANADVVDAWWVEEVSVQVASDIASREYIPSEWLEAGEIQQMFPTTSLASLNDASGGRGFPKAWAAVIEQGGILSPVGATMQSLSQKLALLKESGRYLPSAEYIHSLCREETEVRHFNRAHRIPASGTLESFAVYCPGRGVVSSSILAFALNYASRLYRLGGPDINQLEQFEQKLNSALRQRRYSNMELRYPDTEG